MFFYYFMLICSIFIPILMHIIGIILSKKPPKWINDYYGYRTKRSKMNQKTWDFAQVYIGKIWSRLSLILLLISIVPFIYLTDSKEDTLAVVGFILMMIQVVIMSLTIVPVEKALKKLIDEDKDTLK